MAILAVLGGLLLAVAVVLREYQLGRERRAFTGALRTLNDNLDSLAKRLRRAEEDGFLLAKLLQERELLTPADLARARRRYIERPAARAAERRQQLKEGEAAVTDDGEQTLH